MLPTVIAPPTIHRYADKSDSGKDGIQNAQRKVDKQFDGDAAVFGNATLQGLDCVGTIDDGQLVKMPVSKPPTDQRTGQAIDAN